MCLIHIISQAPKRVGFSSVGICRPHIHVSQTDTSIQERYYPYYLKL